MLVNMYSKNTEVLQGDHISELSDNELLGVFGGGGTDLSYSQDADDVCSHNQHNGSITHGFPWSGDWSDDWGSSWNNEGNGWGSSWNNGGNG